MNLVRQDKSMAFETKLHYCRAARHGLPCEIVVPTLIKPAKLKDRCTRGDWSQGLVAGTGPL